MPYKDPQQRRSRHREYMRTYLKTHRAAVKHRALVKANAARQRAAVRALVSEFRSQGCSLCGEADPVCLDAHHLDAGKKDLSIARMATMRWSRARAQAELAKCVCVCANCHRKIHAGKLTAIAPASA